MKYQFTINGQTMRGELDAATVARFASDGIPLAILRRRHYRRGAEPHVEWYTDAEHAQMLADGWELVKVLADGEDVAPEPPPAPTEAEQAAAEAQRLAALHSALPATVRAALAAMQSLVAMGVQIDLSAGLPGWRTIGPAIAARRMEIATMPEMYAALDAAADMADGYWRDVVFWCGSDRAAYRLAPALAQIGA